MVKEWCSPHITQKGFKQWCPVPEHARTQGSPESALASTNGFMIVWTSVWLLTKHPLKGLRRFLPQCRRAFVIPNPPSLTWVLFQFSGSYFIYVKTTSCFLLHFSLDWDGACFSGFFEVNLVVSGLSCGMQTLGCNMGSLVPWPEIKPGPPALGV